MKVLLVNTFHYARGGDCTYSFSLADLLRSHGHEVVFFGMKHPKNLPCDQEPYFVEHIDFVEAHRSRNPLDAVRVLARSIHSPQSRRNIARLLDDLKPDVAHLQNIHAHLTPSILYELESRGIPALWTLHDYKLICPNTHLLSNGSVCESCKGGSFLSCAAKKCKKGSRAASLVASIEAMVHRWQQVRSKVDTFISPSRFLIDKFVDFGWPEDGIRHVRNFLVPSKFENAGVTDGGYGLYLGQLEPWKGVETLLRAWAGVDGMPLRILGNGTERERLERLATELGLDNVRFEGHLGGDELEAAVGNASFVCVPSEWYENCPYSVMESMAVGKPVISSRIGGLPELVRDGETGLLHEAGDVDQLAQAIRRIAGDASLRREMGARGREIALEEFAPDRHYERIANAYAESLRATSLAAAAV